MLCCWYEQISTRDESILPSNFDGQLRDNFDIAQISEPGKKMLYLA